MFEENTDNVSVREDLSVSSGIYQANASDSDYGADGDIQYSIKAGNERGYFTINPQTGMVSVAKQLNHLEANGGVNLTIEVTDLAPESVSRKTSSMLLKIYIIYTGNTAPVFSQSVSDRSVPEDTAVDTVIVKVNASDPNPGSDGVLSFSIKFGNSNGFFKIDQSSGDVKVNKPLDLETETHAPGASYSLTIEARDQGTPPLSANETVNIHVTGVNEFSPSVVSGDTEVISEKNAVGKIIGKVMATDQDYGDDGKLTYTIASGNDKGYFGINQTSGKWGW